MSVANTTIVARLARLEFATTPNGHSRCNLTLPVDNRRTDTTTWWTATLFGKSAETAAKHLRKGSWVAVSGQAHVRTYNKKDGSQGFSAELDNCNFTFVGNRQDEGGGMEHNRGTASPDIPF